MQQGGIYMVILVLAFAAVGIAIVGIEIIRKKRYERTDYYQQTKNSYRDIQLDKGLSGEFYTYQDLRSLNGYKRYLFNLYLIIF